MPILEEAFPPYLFLQPEQRVKDRFRPRWTAGDVFVDRDDLINTLQGTVVVVDPAGSGAGTNTDDPFGLAHLVVDPVQYRYLLVGDCAADNEQIRLPGGKTDNLGPEAGDVVLRGRRAHKFDRAAGRAENIWPDRILPSPVDDVVKPRGDDGVTQACFDS